ncbi:hypothetical protein [Mesorhizobium silamurunense]|uniref:hypothetical protein n=1 Tax=Mesorhizobium silamurunense TaxID=499528 RepID=UPI0017861C69|nr:hypothetical protein [Mesorhizobium silamurunense]
MVARVTVYHIPDHKRSILMGAAMAKGVAAVGDQPRLVPYTGFQAPAGDVAVFYGFDDRLQEIFNAYRAAGRPVVYVDMGYWGRLEGGKWSGYHKVSVNARHPTEYFQRVKHDDKRVARFGLKIEPWRSGSTIIVAGTSGKGAVVDGFYPQQWETEAINTLRKHTDREIIYRPKPSWTGATPIPGSTFCQTKVDIRQWLSDCHAVVTHHSNAAIDGLLAGVPAFCLEGVAAPMACADLDKIESPLFPEGRQQWINDISYCQWTPAEMEAGLAWRHLKDEGLVTA